MISPARRLQDRWRRLRLRARVSSHGERGLPSRPKRAHGRKSYIRLRLRQPPMDTVSRIDDFASTFHHQHPVPSRITMRWIWDE